MRELTSEKAGQDLVLKMGSQGRIVAWGLTYSDLYFINPTKDHSAEDGFEGGKRLL